MMKYSGPCKHQFRPVISKVPKYDGVRYCFKCGSISLGLEVTSIKPKRYIHPVDIDPFLLFSSMMKCDAPSSEINPKYLDVRKEKIKYLSRLCNTNKVSKKTFHLALRYLDLICINMKSAYEDYSDYSVISYFLLAGT